MYPHPTSGNFPGKLQAIAIIQTVIGSLQIIGGIFSGIYVLFLAVITFGFGLIAIPIPILYLIIGILALVSGIKGLKRSPSYGLSLGVAISQLFAILVCDVFSFGCGLACLILIMAAEVKAYFGR